MNYKFRKNYYKLIIGTLICLLLAFLYLGNYNLIENIDNKDIMAMSKQMKNVDTTTTTTTDEHEKKTNIDEAQRKKLYDANNKVHAENGGYDENSDASKSILGAQDLKAKLIGKNTYK
jgi:Zn-dependent oligopeptidase